MRDAVIHNIIGVDNDISIQRLLAHRANLFFEVLVMVIGIASG